MGTRTIQRIGGSLALAALLWPALNSICQGAATSAPPLSTAQVVGRMVTMNRARAEALRSYTSTYVYHVENCDHNKSADLAVKVAFVWPDRKEATILYESGSEVLRNRVLRRLMESEMEAAQAENRQRTELNPENYDFRLVDSERTGQSDYYVLEVAPKNKGKFLFEGRIWVNAEDFGIVRMEGAPAKNPSWWTTHVDVNRSYCKVGDFWLPARNETVAQVRMFGRSVLTIVYKDYKLLEAFRVHPPATLTAAVQATGLPRD